MSVSLLRDTGILAGDSLKELTSLHCFMLGINLEIAGKETAHNGRKP
jgi:hypothetical protein